MKKIISFLIFAVLLTASFVYAVSVEVSISPFFPIDSTIKSIYGEGWPDFAFMIDHVQPIKSVPQLSFFGQVDYLFKDGFSLELHQKTNIKLIPLAIGLKWIQPVHNDQIELYAGLAPQCYFMQIHNDSDYVPATSSQHACGAYAKIGTYLYPTTHCMIDIFLSYSSIYFKAPASTLAYTGFSSNLSGINCGVGLGCNF